MFTDGEDTTSELSASQVAAQLVKANVVLDVISVAKKRSVELLGLAKVSGGYAIAPDSLEDGFATMGMETMLSTRDRRPVEVNTRLSVPRRFAAAKKQAWDVVDGDTVPAIRQHDSLAKRATSLDDALAPPAKRARTTPSSHTKRLMRELTALKASPHPAIDVYPVDGDIGFWKIVIAGPEGGLYEGGNFLAGIEFPQEYPTVAPVLRFVSEIRHVNVNRQGRVCHEILEGDYGPDVTVHDILSFVYGLLMFPNHDTATDTNLASLFYEYPLRYRQAVTRCTQKARLKLRSEWAEELLADD